MIKGLLSFYFLMLYSMLHAQQNFTICMDKIIVYGGEEQTIKNYLRIPDVLAFGLDSKWNIKMMPNAFGFEAGKGSFNCFNTIPNESADYRISATISIRSEVSFDVVVQNRKTQSMHYLPLVYGSKHELFKPFEELVDYIQNEISKFETLTKLKTLSRYGFVAEVPEDKKNPAYPEFISDLMHELEGLESSTKLLALMPWDSTRIYSFQNYNGMKLLNELELKALIKVQFTLTNDKYKIKPFLYLKESALEIPIYTSQLNYDDKNHLLGPFRKDVDELLKFLYYDDGIVRAENFDFLTTDHGNNFDSVVNNAKKYWRSAQYFKALFLANRAIELNSTGYKGHEVVALVRLAQGRFNEAIQPIKKALEYDNDEVRIKLYYAIAGKIYEYLLEDKESLVWYKKLYELDLQYNDADFGEINYLLGINYMRVADYTKAIKHFEKALDIPSKYSITKWPEDVYFNLGHSYFYLKNYSKAIDCYTYVFKNRPNEYPKIKISISNAYYEQARDKFDTENYTEAIRLVQKSMEYYEDHLAYSLYARSLGNLEKFKETRKLILDNLKEGKLEPVILKEQGQVFRSMFYNKNATVTVAREGIFYYKRYLDFNQNDSSSMYDLGNMYSSINENDSAIIYLEKAVVDKRYNDFVGLLDLAEAYIKGGKPEKVVPLFSTSHAQNLQKKSILPKESEALKLYLILVAKLFLNENATTYQLELDKVRTKDLRITNWVFGPMKRWVIEQKSNDPAKKEVLALTDLVAQHSTRKNDN